MILRTVVALILAASLLGAQTLSPEARLEAAINAEVVTGDVKGALDQYQKILAQTGNNRAVAARALLGIASCQTKLGQRAEAQATYASVIQSYADQPDAVQKAKRQMSAASTATGPVNLNFQNGIGESATGWFIPNALKEAGYSAEVKHEGCLESSSCVVVIASASPKENMFGNVMQFFDATPYRGKKIRLRASLKLDSAAPNDSAQMWLRVDRVQGAAFLDNMGDRPVKSAVWSPVEIIAKVADDAIRINIGVMSIGKGRAWADGMTFEVTSEQTPETGVYSISRNAPQNLDFSRGAVGAAPTAWSVNSQRGNSAEVRRIGCRGAGPCAVVIGNSFGNLAQYIRADDYRGKTVRLRAWMKLDAVTPADTAQMWLRIDLPDRRTGSFDNMDDRPITTAEWKPAEIVLKVAVNAETINFGFMSTQKGTAWVDGVTFELVPDTTPITGTMGAQAPRNLDFTQTTRTGLPANWFGVMTDGYSFEVRHTGCAVKPVCAAVLGSALPNPKQRFGSMGQAFSAAPYRGKTVRFRAKLKMDAVEPNNKAQLWFRVDMPDHKTSSFFDNMDNRPVQSPNWTDAEIVGKIDPQADMITLGILTTGKGVAMVDALSVEVVPDGTPTTDMLKHQQP